MDGLRFGIIGAGNMGGAILRACIDNSLFEPSEMFVFDVSEQKTERFKTDGLNVSPSPEALVAACDIVLLAVKPQIFGAVLDQISTYSSGRCFVSIAAGITSDYIKSKIAEDSFVVRVMPNAPLQFACGATLIAQNDGVPEPLFEKVVNLFSTVGETAVLDESLINAATAVSGSSPAYFYRIADVIAGYAEKKGIDRALALRLAAKSMQGAAITMLSSQSSPDSLISEVASPGGTTEAALKSLDDSNFDDILTLALERCLERADELGKKTP